MESSRLEVRSEFKQNGIVISRVGVGGISVVSLYSSQQRPNNDTLYYMSHCLTACIYMYYMSLLSHCMYIHVLHVSLHVYTCTVCLTACIHVWVGYFTFLFFLISLNVHVFPCTTCLTACIHVLHVSLHVYMYCMSHWLSAWSELPAVWSQTCTFCSSHDESVCVSAESDPPDKHRSVKPPHREM